jgi:hypothetical protein
MSYLISQQYKQNKLRDTAFGQMNLNQATEAPRACVRPPLTGRHKGVVPGDVAWRVGASQGEDIWITIERPVCVFGAARSGKGVHIVVNAIIQAPGSVITTSTRDDNLRMTALCRASRGPVHVFNLDEVGGRPHTIKWSPLEGCEDPAIASLRAGTLVASSGLGGENQVWATSGTKIVQAMLHAAALAGFGIEKIYEWTESPQATKEALEILERRSKDKDNPHLDGWHQALKALIDDDARMKSNKWFGVDNGFASIARFEVRRKLNHKPGDAGYFNTKEFLETCGTIYMIAKGADTSKQTAGTVGGMYALFLDHVVDQAHSLSQRRTGGRLDPNLTLILDEIAAIFPWQRAARESAEGSGVGVQLMTVFQTWQQAEAAYGDMANILKDNSTLVVLGNSKDGDFLEGVAGLAGKRMVTENSHSYDRKTIFGSNVNTSQREVQGVTADELRRLPFGIAALLEGNMRLTIVDMIPYWESEHKTCIQASLKWHDENPGRVLSSRVTQRSQNPAGPGLRRRKKNSSNSEFSLTA